MKGNTKKIYLKKKVVSHLSGISKKIYLKKEKKMSKER